MARSPRRILTPRITQEELNDRTRKTLLEKGANHHIQAAFLHQLSIEVWHYENPVLLPLRPRVRQRQAIAWVLAFQVIEDLLRTTHSTLSLDVFDRERNQTHQRVNVGLLTHLYQKSDFILQLLRATERSRRLPLKDRVPDIWTISGDGDLVEKSILPRPT
jgi:hypothetical protein